MKPVSQRAASLLLMLAAFLWGGSVIAQKWGVTHFPPLRLALLRGVGATLCLLPFWWGSNDRRPFKRGELPLLFSLAFLSMIGNQLANYYGLRTIPASEAGIIMGSTPVLTALLSALFFREPLTRRRTAGCLLSFIGIVLVVARPPQAQAVASWRGDLFVCLGVLSWVSYTLLARSILKEHSSLALTMATFSIGTMLIVPLAIWETAPLQSVPPSAWGALTYLILFASVIAFFAWNIGLQAVGPTRASIFSNLIPVTALVLGVVLLSETISIKQLAGMGLILVSVWMVNRREGES
ncbi:DMT family transporter [Candidatus Manganitrophus noduliformans]|uniref:EamA family transporter n=1 Tax=Candidatus Manganitrophus noduliformans TaxID=2606439 RepID=A0A7X6DM51_9BACT|nr:EamA family transporter [Candidatus Manganitrophus noduliformans]NKE69725.1 EamA family transporter [Candidatus Manganitrophus noduliformans]